MRRARSAACKERGLVVGSIQVGQAPSVSGQAVRKFSKAISAGVARSSVLVALYVPAVGALLVVVLVSAKTGMPIAMFTRDPADIAQISPFAGIISNLGILFWCAGATVCFLTYLHLKLSVENVSVALFFLASGIITTILMLDDFFLLHERVYPEFLHLRQRYTYLIYAGLVFAYLVSFHTIVLQGKYALLLSAFMLFGLSLAVDMTSKYLTEAVPFYHLFEDGFKLLGIVSWLGYFGSYSLQRVAGKSPRVSKPGVCG